MAKTVLVAGASGFIGNRLVQTLLDAGVPVRCLVRWEVPLPAAAQAVRGDLLEPMSLPIALVNPL